MRYFWGAKKNTKPCPTESSYQVQVAVPPTVIILEEEEWIKNHQEPPKKKKKNPTMLENFIQTQNVGHKKQMSGGNKMAGY